MYFLSLTRLLREIIYGKIIYSMNFTIYDILQNSIESVYYLALVRNILCKAKTETKFSVSANI